MSNFVKRARELEDEGNFEGALNYFEMAVEERTGPYDIRCEMGRVLNKLRRFDEALDYFDTVLIMDEEHIESLFGKGIAYLGLNEWKKAFNNFNTARKLDIENANLWYYISIILNRFNLEKESIQFYKKFLEYDDDNFKKIREYYQFGLLFNEEEVKLKLSDKHYNIEGYSELLKNLGLNDNEISHYLKVYPLEILKEKINLLKGDYNKKNEIKIIYKEFIKMGLDKEDVDGFFEDLTVDDLKEKIVSKTGNNPFDKGIIIPDIPLYDNFKSMPINYAYNYKIPEELDIGEIEIIIKESNQVNNKFKKHGILGKLISLTIRDFFKKEEKNININQSAQKEKKSRKYINQHFKLVNNAIFEENYEKAGSLIKMISKFDLTNFIDLKIKLDFYNALLEYYHEKQFSKALNSLMNIENEWDDLDIEPVYLYHKANLLYDLGSYDEALRLYDEILYYDNQKTINRDYIYYLKSSSYYHKSDYIRAYESYKNISIKNQNKNVLNYICKK